MNFGRTQTLLKREALAAQSGRAGRFAAVSLLRLCFFLLLACSVAGGCLGLGAIRGIIDGAPDISAANIMPLGNASFIYDSEGNQLQKLTGAGGNRISISISEIPKDMQHAIVAVEDMRFYDHNGIDPSGIVRAGVNAILRGFRNAEGASTITQQLLKNNVFVDWMEENTLERVRRKIQEQYLALRLESSLRASGINAKDLILENYLNTVNMGSGCYGVQTASQKYFGKDAKDLTLSECAVLAAIPNKPTRYNPRLHPDKNAERRQKVLEDMEEQGYITHEQYTEALNDNVYERIAAYSETQAEDIPYSYFTDEVINRLIDDLKTQKGYTEIQAKNVVYSGGLQIYTTQDSRIQSILDEEFQNEENFPVNTQMGLDWALTVDHADGERRNYSREMLQLYFRNQDPTFDLLFDSQEEGQSYIDQYKAAVVGPGDTIVAERTTFSMQPQASMAVIDQRTGYVKAIVGGRGQKTASLTLNRATGSYSQPGSTFKILSTYGPAMDLGAVNLATEIMDEPFSYTDGTPLKNADGHYHGMVSVREAIVHSYNIPAVKTLIQITPDTGFHYLLNLGFSRLVSTDIIEPLAIGGITNGVSMLELTGAFAAVANGGEFNKPIFYTKVIDSEGNVLIDNTRNVSVPVFKSSTAFLLTSAMEDVVARGTGTACQLNNMHVAGKTGTTNESKDLVFAGFTPYYTAAIWAGYDTHAEIPKESRGFQQTLWAKIMNRIHEGLPDVDFEMPPTVKEVTVCSKTGLLTRYSCKGRTEYYALSDIPTERCAGHYVPPAPTPVPTAAPTPETPAPDANAGGTADAPPASDANTGGTADAPPAPDANTGGTADAPPAPETPAGDQPPETSGTQP